MKISNGLKIATSNKSLSYKLLLYKFIVTVIGGALIYLFASIIIRPVLNSEQFKSVIDILKRIIVNYFDVGSTQVLDFTDSLTTVLDDLSAFIVGMKGNIISSVILGFLVLQLMKFLYARLRLPQ